YKAKYCSSYYGESLNITSGNKKVTIHLSQNEILYCMSDLINDATRTDLVIEGNVFPTSPTPFAESINRTGGVAMLLGIVNRCDTQQNLRDALEMMLCCLERSSELFNECNKKRGIYVLDFLLHKKKDLLSEEVLQKLLEFAGIAPHGDFVIPTRVEIITELVLDFKLLKNYAHRVEYVLKMLRIVCESSSGKSLESLNTGNLTEKVLELYIDLSTDGCVIKSASDFLLAMFAVNFNNSQIGVILQIVEEFFDMVKLNSKSIKRETIIQNAIIFDRCNRLLMLIDQIITSQRLTINVSVEYFYKFFNFEEIDDMLFCPLLRLCTDFSAVSRQFCFELCRDVDVFCRISNKFLISKDTVDCLLALFLNTSPLCKDLLSNANTDLKTPTAIFVRVINEAICGVLRPDVTPDDTSFETIKYLVSMATLVFLQFPNYRTLVLKKEDMYRSVVKTIIQCFSLEETKISPQLKALKNYVVKLFGHLIAASLLEGDEYQKLFFDLYTSQNSVLKNVIDLTSQHLQLIFSFVPREQLSVIYTKYANFVIDLVLLENVDLSVMEVEEMISPLFCIYQQHKEFHSESHDLLWGQVFDRLTLIIFEYVDEENAIFAAQYCHSQTYFFGKSHSDIYIFSLLRNVLQKIVNWRNENSRLLYVGVLKWIAMSFPKQLEKKLPRNLKKLFKPLPQMGNVEADEYLKSKASDVDKVVELSNQYLQFYKMEQNQRVDDLRGRICKRKENQIREERRLQKSATPKFEFDDRSDRSESFEKVDRSDRYERLATSEVLEKVEIVGAIENIGNFKTLTGLSKSPKLEKPRKSDGGEKRETLILGKTPELNFRCSFDEIKTMWKTMKVKLRMPGGVWEDEVSYLKIDEVFGPFFVKHRIVQDYSFSKRYTIQNNGGKIKLTLNPNYEKCETNIFKNNKTKSAGIDFQCLHIVGIDELECVLSIEDEDFCVTDIGKEKGVERGFWRLCKKDTVVMKRRYLLQSNAFEMFTKDGVSVFLAFPRNYDRVLKIVLKTQLMAQDMFTADLNSTIALRFNKASLSQEDVTNLWRNGEISNFEYLMSLNCRAGRSFNDLSQYYIFPWVLKNYESESLDITDAKNYRKLGFPIVAQEEGMREKLQSKFKETKSHYGNHYSSIATSLIFLFSAEPYSYFHIKLFDGHFDSQRLFVSIQKLFNNLLSTPIELIPEFFYLPQFLINFNQINFAKEPNASKAKNIESKTSGKKTSKSASFGSANEMEKLGSSHSVNVRNTISLENEQASATEEKKEHKVEPKPLENCIESISLPPWAHNNPRLFVQTNIEALESEYVSDHLNEWIDLIFGYKQRGEMAEKWCNTYPVSSYEPVDFTKMDAKKREVMKISIRDFGQTPLQLFNKAHPKRDVKHTQFKSNFVKFFATKGKLNYTIEVVKKTGFPIGGIEFTEKNDIQIMRRDEALYETLRIKIIGNGILRLERNSHQYFIEEVQWGKVLKTDGRLVVVGGNDGSLSVIDIERDKGKKVGRIYGHRHAVRQCCIGSIQHILITCDRNVYCIWDTGSLNCLHRYSVEEEIVDIDINNTTGDFVILTTHNVMHCDINGDLISVVKGSEEENYTSLKVLESPLWKDELQVLVGNAKGELLFYVFRQAGQVMNQLINKIAMYPAPIQVIRMNENNCQITIGTTNGVVLILY
ncbi:beige/beach domain containing protein, partial [Entamoeba invadens IP1]|uniref:beige/beach domain containing protein n=1 Tax=Entamoeba invadens IP1 TaxID=370355 RepID=UPI0002C3F56E